MPKKVQVSKKRCSGTKETQQCNWFITADAHCCWLLSHCCYCCCLLSAAASSSSGLLFVPPPPPPPPPPLDLYSSSHRPLRTHTLVFFLPVWVSWVLSPCLLASCILFFKVVSSSRLTHFHSTYSVPAVVAADVSWSTYRCINRATFSHCFCYILFCFWVLVWWFVITKDIHVFCLLYITPYSVKIHHPQRIFLALPCVSPT